VGFVGLELGVSKKTKKPDLTEKTEKKLTKKNRTSKKNRFNRLKYLEKYLVRFGFQFWCA
jgi:hypothetical protein